MKFHISKTKLMRRRALEFVDLVVKYPENKNNYIYYKDIYKHYNISNISYNGYMRIMTSLIYPHIKDIEIILGIIINIHKFDNESLCMRYKFKKK